jgi:hypothetical protein
VDGFVVVFVHLFVGLLQPFVAFGFVALFFVDLVVTTIFLFVLYLGQCRSAIIVVVVSKCTLFLLGTNSDYGIMFYLRFYYCTGVLMRAAMPQKFLRIVLYHISHRMPYYMIAYYISIP